MTMTMTASAGKRLRITITAESGASDVLQVVGAAVKDFIDSQHQQCLYGCPQGNILIRRTRAGGISVYLE